MPSLVSCRSGSVTPSRWSGCRAGYLGLERVGEVLNVAKAAEVELDEAADRVAGLVQLLLDSFALFLARSDEVALDPVAGERPNDR